MGYSVTCCSSKKNKAVFLHSLPSGWSLTTYTALITWFSSFSYSATTYTTFSPYLAFDVIFCEKSGILQFFSVAVFNSAHPGLGNLLTVFPATIALYSWYFYCNIRLFIGWFLEIAKATCIVGWWCLVCYQGLFWFRLEVHNRRPLTATAAAEAATADCPWHRFSIRQGKQTTYICFLLKNCPRLLFHFCAERFAFFTPL